MKRILAVFLLLGACASGPSAQDQADLVRVGATLGAACASSAISAEDCTAARDALLRLGVSLEQVQQARLLAEAWDVARPVVTAGVSILVGLITGGGA